MILFTLLLIASHSCVLDTPPCLVHPQVQTDVDKQEQEREVLKHALLVQGLAVPKATIPAAKR